MSPRVRKPPRASTEQVSPARLVRRVAWLLGPRWRVKTGGLLLLGIFASALEVLGIGIFLPYLGIVRDPEQVLGNERYGPLLEQIGVTDPRTLVITAGLGLLVVFVLKNGYLTVQWWVLARFIHRELRHFATRMFADYLRAPYLFHAGQNSSRLIRNITAEVKHAFSDVFGQGIRLVVEVLVFVGIVAALFVISPLAAAGGLVFLGGLAWGMDRVARRHLHRIGEVRAEASANRYMWAAQGLGAVKEIQILGREDYFIDQFDHWERKITDAMRDSGLATTYPRLVLETAAVLFLVGLITVPSLAGVQIQEALGTLVIFGIALVRLLPAVSRIGGSTNRLRFAAHALDILYEEYETLDALRRDEPAPGAPTIHFRDRIDLENVSYRYPGREEDAVRGASLTVRRGESVGFAGASGGGKTTLLHMLVGLLLPTEGRILVDGIDVSLNPQSWQREIGFVSQDLYLLDDTVRRNVAFGIPDAEIDDEAVWRALDLAQLGDVIRDIGQGLEAPVGERGVGLSGGQRQRLAIARALYHDPPVLVLDEPTSALDRETEIQLEQTIRGLNQIKTVLIVSHRPKALENCDAIYVLEGGRIVRSESHEKIELSPGR